jgi:hypothetical protein
MEQQIDRSADPKPFEHGSTRRTDAWDIMDRRVEFESVGQVPYLQLLGFGLRKPKVLGSKRENFSWKSAF